MGLTRYAVLAMTIASGLNLKPQNSETKSADRAIEVSLDLREGGRWRAVDAQRVFQDNDEIRFSFRTTFGGYLYVLNHSSDGRRTWLYPRTERNQSSRVEPGAMYLIPGSNGSYVVGGSPGFDITYWVVSLAPIEESQPTSVMPDSKPNTLLPRCREEVLKARGLCVDDRAGPRGIGAPDQIPPELRGSDAPLIARELRFRTDGGPTRITAPGSRHGIIVYEFRIAHK